MFVVQGKPFAAGPQFTGGLAMIAIGSFVKVRDGVTASEGLGGALCRVVGAQGDLRDIRRVDVATGELKGISVRFVSSELVPVQRR
ncbi:hypothetical protein [Mycobacterium intracellulare]|uniref:hypothetical protein n=1 Tax=Mycobacterium intracellulare TaxID=1767 RepID=UPI001EEDB30B|nr:hypothetical protein [Mycobacterium intracellulare]MEE3755376.1 hypothetical protein [Mycobacterium intracellulare]